MRLRRSKLSPSQSLRLCEHFVAGTSARAVAELVGVNKNTAALFYRRLRETIADEVENNGPPATGDDWVASYCAGNGKRSALGIAGHPLVLQILRHGGRHYARLIVGDDSSPVIPGSGPGPTARSADNRGREELRSIPEGRGEEQWPGYGIFDRGDSVAVHGHGEQWFQHVSRQLKTYNGIPEQNLRLFLKECEWRLNYGSDADLLETLMSWLKASGKVVASDRWS